MGWTMRLDGVGWGWTGLDERLDGLDNAGKVGRVGKVGIRGRRLDGKGPNFQQISFFVSNLSLSHCL